MPRMIDIFNMVDMGGIDVVKAQGEEVDGLFLRLLNSIQNCRYSVLCNWLFAEIPIAPTYVELIFDGEQVSINDLITVTQDDIVHVHSLEIPIEPVIRPLSVGENGVFTPPEGVDGFSPVNVNVPQPFPVIQSLSVTENGTYNPPLGVDGYSPIEVNVPQQIPVIQPLSVTENGAYNPPVGVDGYSPIEVNVSSRPADYSSIPDEYQEVEYIGFNNGQYVTINHDGIFTLELDAYQDTPTGTSLILGYRDYTTANDDFNLGSTGSGQRWFFRSNRNYILSSYSFENQRLRTICSIWSSSFRKFFVGKYQSSTSSQAFIGRIYSCKVYNPVNSTWISYLVPCYEKASGTIGFYDAASDTFKPNEGTETFYKGPDKN